MGSAKRAAPVGLSGRWVDEGGVWVGEALGVGPDEYLAVVGRLVRRAGEGSSVGLAKRTALADVSGGGGLMKGVRGRVIRPV